MARLTKVCSKCKERKPLSNFYKDKYSKDGYRGHCKQCDNNRHSIYYQKNRQKIDKRAADIRRQNPRRYLNYRLKNIYNMSVEDFDKKLFEQNGVCAICGKKETIKNQYNVQRLGIDHNHLTDKNRGLLCTHCNTAIGSLYVDENGIDLLLKAIEYVRKYDE